MAKLVKSHFGVSSASINYAIYWAMTHQHFSLLQQTKLQLSPLLHFTANLPKSLARAQSLY